MENNSDPITTNTSKVVRFDQIDELFDNGDVFTNKETMSNSVMDVTRTSFPVNTGSNNEDTDSVF